VVRARDEGLIAGVGLSNVSLEQLRHAAEGIEIVCVQNLFHLAEPRIGTGPSGVHPPRERLRAVLLARPDEGRGQPGAHQPDGHPDGRPPRRHPAAGGSCSWYPTCCLIPGTGPTGHLRENLAAEHVALDDQALRELAGVGV
jgi:pyridoxine 4-dehydrogenase